MFTRKLGRSGLEVSALGMGCWAIGGPWTYEYDNAPHPAGWGQIDDDESIKAIHASMEMGVNFFDTAANYGAGHSEHILGRALAGRRDQVVIATKFGYLVDEERKWIIKDHDAVLGNIREDCEKSLRRLNTDHIDIYQFHVGDYDPEKAPAVMEVLESLVGEGKIRWYGWSTDHAESAKVFAKGEHCTSIQQMINWATSIDYAPTLNVCEEFGLASIIRGPLSKGFLTGKFKDGNKKFPEDDVRHGVNLKDEPFIKLHKALDAVSEILTSEGRTLAQGALCWLWARSDCTIPIPGFKSMAQVRENAGALEFGPLSPEQMQQIDEVLGRNQ
jgi:aryl-alcohol dehydrogenase-like predicted oxidoreductase